MKPTNSILSAYETSVFEVMSRLAREHKAVNLGQGFPDTNGPDDVRRVAVQATEEGPNQYPPSPGLPELRQAVARHDKRFYGLDLDWEREVIVTCGGTEALASCFFGLIEPGDEVVLFQPLYDAYLPLVLRAGGVPKLVRLKPPDWRFDEEMLSRAFSPRTRVVLFNNPLNPTATVYGEDQLSLLAHFCMANNSIIVCDEVWEHVVFDGRRHISMFAVPGMRSRTVKIGSAGKIFSLTGWKVGFVCAAPEILRVLAKAHQYITFTTPPNLQTAVTYGLGKDDSYFEEMRRDLARSRDRFTKGLKQIGFPVLESQGTYFVSVDLAPLGLNIDDESFCKRLVAEHKVAAIPVSAFYAEDPVKSVVRFCFAKKDATLDGALERLAGALRGRI